MLLFGDKPLGTKSTAAPTLYTVWAVPWCGYVCPAATPGVSHSDVTILGLGIDSPLRTAVRHCIPFLITCTLFLPQVGAASLFLSERHTSSTSPGGWVNFSSSRLFQWNVDVPDELRKTKVTCKWWLEFSPSSLYSLGGRTLVMLRGRKPGIPWRWDCRLTARFWRAPWRCP